jgi:hypothetical protein
VFARVLRDGFALAATGTAEAFPAIAAHHLTLLLDAADRRSDDATVEHVLGGFDEVEPHSDVTEGLSLAGEAGLTVATLTNGTAEITRRFLSRSGLDERVECEGGGGVGVEVPGCTERDGEQHPGGGDDVSDAREDDATDPPVGCGWDAPCRVAVDAASARPCG